MARNRTGLFLVVFVSLLCIGGATGLILLAINQPIEPATPETREEPKPEPKIEPKPLPPREAAPAPKAGPRRLKVAGQEGYYVVIEPDGSSVMEAPDGKKTFLTGPVSKDELPEDAIVKKLEETSPKRVGLGQLVVTDTGIVDIPKDAVVTLIGRDKVVTHGPDGTSVVYFVDGRVVRQARGQRDPK
jgi:hypothetical protein